MAASKPELKVECIRLRVEERLSYRELQERLGVSKGSLSSWLKGYPLTAEEKRECLKRAHPGAWNKGRKKERGTESEIHSLVRSKGLNGVQVAKVSETAVLLRLLIHGFNPFGSVFDGDKTDWLVEVPSTGQVHKIQVKTAWRPNKGHGLSTVSLHFGRGRRTGGRYQKGDFDFLVGYDLFTDICYVWNWEELTHLTSAVTICPDAQERWDKLGG